MGIRKFEDIIAWQKAQDYSVALYSIFRNFKDYGFRDQILRAGVSISNNIAEGFDRSSNADFSKFLYMSLGSCSEVKSMVYLAFKLSYISTEQKDKLALESEEISKIIRGLIKSLQSKNLKH